MWKRLELSELEFWEEMHFEEGKAETVSFHLSFYKENSPVSLKFYIDGKEKLGLFGPLCQRIQKNAQYSESKEHPLSDFQFL